MDDSLRAGFVRLLNSVTPPDRAGVRYPRGRGRVRRVNPIKQLVRIEDMSRFGWLDFANCKGTIDFDPFIDLAATKKIEKMKEKYCRHCCVRQECLDFAFETDSDGIFGGFTKEERNRMAPFLKKSISVSVVAVSIQLMVDQSGASLNSKLRALEHPTHEQISDPSHTSSQRNHSQSVLSTAVESLMECLAEWTENLERLSPDLQASHSSQSPPSLHFLDELGNFPQQSHQPPALN